MTIDHWSGNRATEITKSIGVFIAKDIRPYSVVENEGFQHMINVLESRYDLPSRVHFSEKAIPNLYEKAKAEVESDLKNAEFVPVEKQLFSSQVIPCQKRKGNLLWMIFLEMFS